MVIKLNKREGGGKGQGDTRREGDVEEGGGGGGQEEKARHMPACRKPFVMN